MRNFAAALIVASAVVALTDRNIGYQRKHLLNFCALVVEIKIHRCAATIDGSSSHPSRPF